MNNLKYFRLKNNLTVRDLATLTKSISSSAISAIENGQIRINEGHLEIFSKLLNCEPEDLIKDLTKVRDEGSFINIVDQKGRILFKINKSLLSDHLSDIDDINLNFDVKQKKISLENLLLNINNIFKKQT